MKIALILLSIVLVVLFFVIYVLPSDTPSTTTYPDYKNAAYEIEGQIITLVDGKVETSETPGGPKVVQTTLFGNEVEADFDADNDTDIAFILTQTGSGSGTFYYLAVAKKVDGGYVGLNAHYLGDRIAPQSTEFTDGRIIVNFSDRAPTDPMTAPPSIGVTKSFTVEDDTVKKVAP